MHSGSRRGLRALAYGCEERYGLVWVALEDPLRPLPEYPWLDDPEFHTWSKFCGIREAGRGSVR